MIIELKDEIEFLYERAIIRLEKCAIPESVKVKYLSHVAEIEGFDKCGHPEFSKRQAQVIETLMFYREKETGNKEQIVVEYEEVKLTLEKEQFNTIDAITNAFRQKCNCALTEVLANRRIFSRISDEGLDEFVLIGRMYLGKYGQTGVIMAPFITGFSQVEKMEDFVLRDTKARIVVEDGLDIVAKFAPKGQSEEEKTSTCPICGKKTMQDIFLKDQSYRSKQAIRKFKEVHYV